MTDVCEIVECGFRLTNAKESKYPFDTLKLGQGFKIPSDIKISTMRVIVSRWNTDNKASGKRFSVFSDDMTVVRVK